MKFSLFQLNPSLSIENNIIENNLRIGHMEPNSFEIEDFVKELKEIVTFLVQNKFLSKNQLLDKIKTLTPIDPNLIFSDLLSLKIIIPALNESNRYAKHEMYFSYTDAQKNYQSALLNKTVLLIGVGGIGSTCATLLAAAGVGNLILADSDKLELSNLTRTILFEEEDIGKYKTEQAKIRIQNRNNRTKISTLRKVLNDNTSEYFEACFQESDLVVLSGDSGAEVHRYSYLLSKKYNKPLINSGYIEHCGIVGPLTVGECAFREKDLSKNTKHIIQLNPNYVASSYGPLNFLVSSITTNEIIRFFNNLEVMSRNRRLILDSYNYYQRWDHCT